MAAAAERDRRVRVEGNINLLAALRDVGVRRYLLQSAGFFYAPGEGRADESAPFTSDASPGVDAAARVYTELESRASAAPGFASRRPALTASSTAPAHGSRARATSAIR